MPFTKAGVLNKPQRNAQTCQNEIQVIACFALGICTFVEVWFLSLRPFSKYW